MKMVYKIYSQWNYSGTGSRAHGHTCEIHTRVYAVED